MHYLGEVENIYATLWQIYSSHLIFYSLKTVAKRNCVQSSYKYTVHI